MDASFRWTPFASCLIFDGSLTIIEACAQVGRRGCRFRRWVQERADLEAREPVSISSSAARFGSAPLQARHSSVWFCSPRTGGDCAEALRTNSDSRLLLDQITDKWSVLILCAVCKKPLRFNEIKRALDGITQKVLTQSLRRLERSGILARRVIPSSQVAVEYSMTPLGRSLEDLFKALFEWMIRHTDEVLQAQALFDKREI